MLYIHIIYTYQFSSVAKLCPTLCNLMNRSTPGLPVHHQLPESTQTHVHVSMMPSKHLMLCPPLLLLPSIFPRIRVFSNESALCIRWPKYWSFSFNISPSNEHPGLISFRMDWLDLFADPQSLLQHHSLKASIILHSAFFIVQLSHPHMTTGKTVALTRQTFVGKIMSLPCLTQWNYEPCRVGTPKTDGSWWRVLTQCGPLEKGMANHFSTLALRTPWTIWKVIDIDVFILFSNCFPI